MWMEQVFLLCCAGCSGKSKNDIFVSIRKDQGIALAVMSDFGLACASLKINLSRETCSLTRWSMQLLSPSADQITCKYTNVDS